MDSSDPIRIIDELIQINKSEIEDLNKDLDSLQDKIERETIMHEAHVLNELSETKSKFEELRDRLNVLRADLDKLETYKVALKGDLRETETIMRDLKNMSNTFFAWRRRNL